MKDGDGSAHLPLQDFHGRIFACSGRSICYRRVAARGAGLFHRQRRFAEAPSAFTSGALSYINLQALPKLIEGQLISDVIACIGTIDIVLGEVDR